MNFIPRILPLLFAVTILSISDSLFAVTNIQDPSGKTVLVVDGDNIKPDASGKPILSIDGDSIKDAGGNLVLYINGDNIRNKPEGTLLLFIDGRNIRREPSGTKLLYVDGNNLMRADRSGKPLYHFAGDELGSRQRMAVLYVLMPELFKGKEDDAAIIAAQRKSAAASDADSIKNFVAGNYAIDIFTSNDATPIRKGTVTAVKNGDVFVMDFKFTSGDPLQAVAIQQGDEVWAAYGKPATLGLAVYKVKTGSLTGTWYNATGKPESFGTENLTGADPLGGDYKITDAKAPFTQAAYTGTLNLEASGKKFDGGLPIFLANWDLGAYKAKGVGFATPDSLAIATSTAPDFSIIHFKINLKDNTLVGQFFQSNKAVGLWTLKKSK